MSKVVWGKYLWKSIHYIALGYPDNPTEDQKLEYKTFYLLLKTVIPCKKCRDHYIENLESNPLNDAALKNKNSLIKWTIDLHNLVNQQLGYPIISYDKALDELTKETFANTINSEINYSQSYSLLIILFIIILFIIYLYKKKILINN